MVYERFENSLRKDIRHRIWIPIVLAGLCFFGYVNSLGNAFVVDDIPAVLKNPVIGEFFRYWLSPQELFNSFSYLAGGYNPFPYHLLSVILHSINTILAFFFLRLFFKTGSSFLAACLFALHPIHVEAVSWISGRPYSFLAFFVFAAYLSYQRATDPRTLNKRFSPGWYIFSLAIFSYFIVSSYSFFSVFPLLLILSDVSFGKWRKNWKWWIPFLGIIMVRLILARYEILGRITNMRNALGNAQAANPAASFIYSLYKHLVLLLWPDRLSFCHEPYIIPQNVLVYGVWYLIPLVALLFFTFRKTRELFFALSIFIIFLAPTYSSIPITSTLVAERYLYFPSIALSIFAAFLFERYTGKYKSLKKFMVAAFILVIICCGARTILRNRDWKTNEILWEKTLAVSPDSWNAHNNMGAIYFARADLDKAAREYERALAINPGYAEAYNNLGVLYYKRNDKEKALAFFEQALALNPGYADACNNLGVMYNERGYTDKAIMLYKKALALNPRYADACNNLASVYESIGDKQEALLWYKKARGLNPVKYSPSR